MAVGMNSGAEQHQAALFPFRRRSSV